MRIGLTCRPSGLGNLILLAIRSFGNRPTKKFAGGDLRPLPPQIRRRARSMLDALDQASSPRDLDRPGARLHALTGSRKGFYAVDLSGKWRLVFRFEDCDAYDVEIVDYH